MRLHSLVFTLLVLFPSAGTVCSAGRLRLAGGYVGLANGNSARRYSVRDHLGSVRAVVNDAGTVLETDDYYPLGGPLPTGSNTALQPEKYQGKDWNTAASFNVYDFGARLYDPALGRWLSQDPLAEKFYPQSPYLFCAGNPMRFVDPEGTTINPVYGSDGSFRGNTLEGFTGIVIIYDGDKDFSNVSASDLLYNESFNILTQRGEANSYDTVRNELTETARSKIWTHIASQMEGLRVYDEVFSLSTLSNGIIGFSSSDKGSWNSRINAKTITGTDKYSYETTVENIQSSVVVHEWYSHIMKGNHDRYEFHRLAYKNVINYKLLWDKTTPSYKAFNLEQLLKYTIIETGRTTVDPPYRNLYKKYKKN